MVMLMTRKITAETRGGHEDRQALGHRLREARKGAGLTLETVAGELNVAVTSVWKWERGRTFPTTDRLERAAKLYEVSMDWLMGSEKRIGETPAIYYPDEAPPTDVEMRLAMEFIRVLRRQRTKYVEPPQGNQQESD